jgi:protein-S-isoprenylcysteine O-methyltransferase Ste14
MSAKPPVDLQQLLKHTPRARRMARRLKYTAAYPCYSAILLLAAPLLVFAWFASSRAFFYACLAGTLLLSVVLLGGYLGALAQADREP